MAGKKKIDLNNLTPDEVLKYEIAGELGLLDRVLEKRLAHPDREGDGTDRRSGDQKKRERWRAGKKQVQVQKYFRKKVKSKI